MAKIQGVVTDDYEAVVIWDRRRVMIPIDSSESTPLVGMRRLENIELTMKVRRDGQVDIRRMQE